MSQTTVRAAVAVIALVPPLGYAVGTWAAGSPSFPGDRAECARVATVDGEGPLEVVAGRFSSVSEAEALAARLAPRGSLSFRVARDGCGRFKVAAVVGSLADAREAVAALGRAGVQARVELDPSPRV